MIRTVSFIQRRHDIDRKRFRRYYETRHAPLAMPKLRGLEHYVRNHVLHHSGTESVTFDTISEFEYRDESAFEAMLEMLGGPQGEILRSDELNFMHKPGNSFFRSTRSRITDNARPAPGTTPKSILILRPGRTCSAAELPRKVGEVAHRASQLRGNVCVETDIPEASHPEQAADWTALVHIWHTQSFTREESSAVLAGPLTEPLGHGLLWIGEAGDRLTQHRQGTRR